jgi:xanthine dehydrogenase YagR molybdenum-binding subunit
VSNRNRPKISGGEIGIVGTAAAIANAVSGVRVRDLPITIDKLLELRQPTSNHAA